MIFFSSEFVEAGEEWRRRTESNSPRFHGDGGEPASPRQEQTLMVGGVQLPASAAYSPGSSAVYSQSSFSWLEAHVQRGYFIRPARVLKPLMGQLTPNGTSPLLHASLEDAVAALEGDVMTPTSLELPAHELCAICLQEFMIDERVQTMRGCRHLFHEACISDHLEAARQRDAANSDDDETGFESTAVCPLCRGAILVTSKEEVPRKEADLLVAIQGGAIMGEMAMSTGEYFNLEFGPGESRRPTDSGGLPAPAPDGGRPPEDVAFV